MAPESTRQTGDYQNGTQDAIGRVDLCIKNYRGGRSRSFTGGGSCSRRSRRESDIGSYHSRDCSCLRVGRRRDSRGEAAASD